MVQINVVVAAAAVIIIVVIIIVVVVVVVGTLPRGENETISGCDVHIREQAT